MGTLDSELAPLADRLSTEPRIYADANVPAGLVTFMRHQLGWNVFFVMEHDELRRARDVQHFRLARQLRRTLLTLDRDYLDDRRFPPQESGGVIVLWAPDERAFVKLLRRLDCVLFQEIAERSEPIDSAGPGLPLAGRKLHAQVGWTGESADA